MMRIRLLATMLLAWTSITAIYAQKAVTVSSFTMTTDHIPSSDRRNDLNGVPCALVKIQVVDDVERVEGNVIGDMVNRGVEKWAYLCKGSRNMRVHLKNHLPVRVVFKNYNINGLESNRVYELVLDVPDQPASQDNGNEVKSNDLQIRVTPANATVFIWGDDLQRKAYRAMDDGTIKVNLPYGRYHYQAQASGYNDLSGSVFVNDENRWVNVDLAAKEGTLFVQGLTKNADFYIDGKPVQKEKSATVWTGQLKPGHYTVETRKPGYVTMSKPVDITANNTASVSFDKLVSEKERKAMDRKLARAEEKKSKEQQQAAEQKAREEKRQRELETAQRKQLERETAQKEQREREAAQRAQRESEVRQSAKVEKEAKKGTVANSGGKRVSFGIRAGINISSMGLDSEVEGSNKTKTGFHLGPAMDVRLAGKLYLNAAMLFSQKGYRFEADDNNYTDVTTTAQFLTIPIQLAYKAGIFRINAGPYIDFGIGGKMKYEGYDYDDDDNTFDYFDSLNFGMTFGIGIEPVSHFSINLGYEAGFTDYSNRNIMFGIGYNF